MGNVFALVSLHPKPTPQIPPRKSVSKLCVNWLGIGIFPVKVSVKVEEKRKNKIRLSW